ncbi:MAG: hypothetical protein AB8G05_12180 [Oligoflexales bacterium]
MARIKKTLDIDWDYIARAFREFLNFCKYQIRDAFRWMERNPEKVAIIVAAVVSAFSGNYDQLIEVGIMLISA